MGIEKKRKIVVITGTRAEFGILTPIIKAINEHSQLELSIIATAMHLEEKFGYTLKEIEKTFPTTKLNKIKIELNNKGAATAEGGGQEIIGCSKALNKLKPDIAVVLGDRSEIIAASIAIMENIVVLAHIHGGDRTKGGFDENRRHAITKLANIHFPASPKSAERIKKLGEKEEHIFMVGSPSLDTILNSPLFSKAEIFEKYNLDINKPTTLLIQHPVTTSPEKSEEQIKATLEALKEENMQTLAIYPNSDPGHEEIIKNLLNSGFSTQKSLPHKEYLSLLKYCDIIIGNSSSGMIDASAFPVAVIDIGIRQEGREHGINVIHCTHSKEEIKKSIKKALSKEFKQNIANPVSPYGKGTAGKQIAEILATIEINQNLLQKQITY